jgi:hypothetical protein
MSNTSNTEPRVRITDPRATTLGGGIIIVKESVDPRKDLLVARDETAIKVEARKCAQSAVPQG